MGVVVLCRMGVGVPDVIFSKNLSRVGTGLANQAPYSPQISALSRQNPVFLGGFCIPCRAACR